MLATKPWLKLAVDYLEQDQPADQMTRDDNVLLNDVYFNAYNMTHQPLTPLTPISKIVSDPLDRPRYNVFSLLFFFLVRKGCNFNPREQSSVMQQEH